MGDVARAVSPHMAYQIGQYFKSNDYKNTQDNQNRPGEQSLQHLMAHAILGAATSYATGQDIGIGALSAVSSETAAPAISKFLFGKDSKELTQDEKDTITNIITLATASTAYAISDGDVAGSVSAAEVGRVAVGNNYFYPIKENHPVPILELTEQDKRYIIYALAEYMVRNNIVSLEDIPDSVYKDMVAGNAIQDDDGNIINANPDYDYYKAEFNKAGSITQDEFRQLIAKYPELYNSLIEKIDRTRFVNEAKDFGLQIAGGVSGVAVSFGQIGEPFLKPLETVEALYDFVQTEDKLLAIQMAVAMDLQNRQELLELHHKNNDTFGIALETSRNTADALLVLTSIHKAPKEIVTLISTLKNAGSVIFKGVKYTYSEGKIVAQKIPSPNANVNTNVPASQNLPNVYGDGDLPNVDSGQNHGGVSLKERIQANIANSQKARESSNFKSHANSENVHRIEHNAKLTTKTDGNLSVTHGLGYDAKKELDGIRAFLVENKADPNQVSYINSKRGEPDAISIATAAVTTKDSKTIHYLAVSGKSWSGHAPDKVTIHGKKYQVIREEAYTGKVLSDGSKEKVLPDHINPDNNQYNGNHAEKKLMSHITQKNQNSNISNVKINIQNTSKESQGACYGCGGQDGMGGTIEDFKNLNPNITIHIEHGSTNTSP